MRKSLLDLQNMIQNKQYPGIIPTNLQEFYYYISDAGHSIMCVLKCHLTEAEDNMDMYEIPIPVKYVLEKEYEIKNGYVVIDAEYTLPYGLLVDERYYEY